MPKPPTTGSPPPPAGRQTIAAQARKVRAWSQANALFLLVIVAALLLPVIGVAWLQKVSTPQANPIDPQATLALALRALDDGALDEAESLAESLSRNSAEETATGGPAYILGVVAGNHAEDLLGAEKAQQHLVAAGQLHLARQRGFPPGREAHGLALLGEHLLRGGRIAESVPVLEAALAADPAGPARVHRMLAEAQQTSQQPDLPAALAHLDACLADPAVSEEERRDLLLDQSRIQFRQEEFDRCRETLDLVPRGSAAAAVLRGRLALHAAQVLRAEGAEANSTDRDGHVDRLLAEALEGFRQAQGRASEPAAAREALLWTGHVLALAGDDEAALSQFQRVWKIHAETPEGLAASHAEAELLLRLGRAPEAATIWRRTLEAVGPADIYTNSWLPLDTLRQSALAAWQHLLEQGQFAESVLVASSLGDLFPVTKRMQLEAEAHRAWGRRLLADASESAQAQGLAELRTAGQIWLHIAALRSTERDYPDQLWNAAEALLAGQDYPAAAETLREYLTQEARKRRAAALVGLGEAHLGRGDLDGALAALGECMRLFPRDAASFRARLLAAKTHALAGQVQPALALLRETIEGDYLTPASREWRESLFALGRLLHLDGQYAEAVSRLEEAIARYPEDPQAAEARYLAAHCYTERARPAQEKLAQATSDSARATYAREVQRLLTNAVERYQESLDWLRAQDQADGLSHWDESLARNSYFFQGAALFELGRYEEAIATYSSATNRYQQSPVALEAYVRIADCYRRLDKRTEFQGTLARARIVLRRLPADAPFKDLTIHDREEWANLLDWLSAL